MNLNTDAQFVYLTCKVFNMNKLLEFGARNHLIYYVLVTMVSLQICASLNPSNPICDTPNCRKLADYYKKNMNQQAKPCSDFYDYVCHGWGAQNPRPKHRLTWNVELLLRERTLTNLREILENEKLNNEGPLKYAKALYKACMNLPRMEKTDALSVKNVMAAIGNWPMVTTKGSTLQNISWWQVESSYISKTGESSLFEFFLISDTTRNKEITLYITPPISPYGMLKLFAPFNAVHKRNYKIFLTNVINIIAPIKTKNSATVIDKDLDDILKFREQLAEISKYRFTINGSRLIKVNELQKWYDKHYSGQDTAKIDWLTITRSMYKNTKEPTNVIIQSTTDIITEFPYHPQLIDILRRTPKHVIENHVHLYFAERHLNINAQLEHYLENSFINGAKPTGTVRNEPEKWVKCVNNHNLDISLGRAYIDSHFPMDNRREVQELLKDEVRLLQTRIFDSSWLDATAKNRSVKKLNNMRSQIGFPDWYNEVGANIHRLAFDLDPTMPTAYYQRQFNKISMSASYLQWPNFMPNMPYVIKYGSTGFVISHELHHAFDYSGLRFDESGQRQLWWSQEMLSNFHARALCLEPQYKKYKKEELQKRHITKPVNDPKTNKPVEVETIDEDIADVMGLKIAYMGYKREFQKRNGICTIIPGFEKYGCDKLFFIAFANLFCADSTPAAEEEMLLTDSHSFSRSRINGAVGNMKEFQQAFGCKPNDPIVPEKMCDIWN